MSQFTPNVAIHIKAPLLSLAGFTEFIDGHFGLSWIPPRDYCVRPSSSPNHLSSEWKTIYIKTDTPPQKLATSIMTTMRALGVFEAEGETVSNLPSMPSNRTRPDR